MTPVPTPVHPGAGRFFCVDGHSAVNEFHIGLVKIPIKTGSGDPRVGQGRHHDAINNTAPTSLGGGYQAAVVDDEVPLAEVVASYLGREMFEVDLAHSGADALATAREIDPDVVALDLALPGIDVCGESPRCLPPLR